MATVTREKLYEEVWSEPMTTVAKRYEVSSNYLARICEQLRIPRPPRGYWQQLTAGRIVKPVRLPEADPGDKVVWERHEGNNYYPSPLPTPTFSGLGEHQTRRKERPKTHPLLVAVRENFEDSKVSKYDDDGYLKPRKSELPDLFVSKGTLNAALGLANRLYLALEDRGHWVRTSSGQQCYRGTLEYREGSIRSDSYDTRIWSPSRPTLVFIGGVAIGLTLFEIAEDVEVMHSNGQWVRIPNNRTKQRLERWQVHRRHLPSGRLGLRAYSPYRRENWGKYWRETKPGEIKGWINDITTELERAAPEIALLGQEAERRAAEEHQRYLVAQQERRQKALAELRTKATQESRQHLVDIVRGWVTARHIEEFFEDLAAGQVNLSDREGAVLKDRIEHARALFGGTEAVQHFSRWATPDERFQRAEKSQR